MLHRVMTLDTFTTLCCIMIPVVIVQSNSLVPAWMNRFTDDEMTGVPKHILELQDKHFYPVRRTLQVLLKSSNRRSFAEINQKTQTRVFHSTNFPCTTNSTRSLIRPSSVHQLRPGDIDIIGSIGDSLSVGLGSFSNSIYEVLIESRGVSWTGGGEGTWKQYLTLPNIIKMFNPKLFGYAYGDALAEERGSQFNVAETGALSVDIFFMTKELVKRIKNDKRVNLNDDWKLITIMLGPNTFCLQLCYEDNIKLLKTYKEKLYNSFLYIKNNLPRTMINFVMSINLNVIINFTGKPLSCQIINRGECPCLLTLQYKNKQQDYINVMEQFKMIEKEVTEMEVFRSTEDFVINLQTFTKNIMFPLNKFNKTDLTYLSADCFHLSQKGYARAANALWNNMMQPVGKKSVNWSKELDGFICPTDEWPYIRTWKNSN